MSEKPPKTLTHLSFFGIKVLSTLQTGSHPMIDFWQQSATELQLPPATVACVVRASAQYDLPPGLVLSVMKVEGATNGAVHRNANGSYDYGLMQINSIWMPKLSSMGFTRDHLINHPCANLSVAAWIMRQNLDASDHFWRGVGNYHSRNARENNDYQHRIAAAAKTLPASWQWWNPKGWDMKRMVALLPWRTKDHGGMPATVEASLETQTPTTTSATLLNTAMAAAAPQNYGDASPVPVSTPMNRATFNAMHQSPTLIDASASLPSMASIVNASWMPGDYSAPPSTSGIWVSSLSR